MSTSPTAPSISTFTRWLIVAIASIGFAFDIYELLMLPLILRPATQELAGALPGSDKFNEWKALMFYVPALFGGVFGLLGGYMTDLLGRRRVLVWSILLYAVSAFLGGFSTSMTMLLVLRTTKFIGVCVEFVAAVAWLAELFPDHYQRERVLGFSQAFSSFGGLLVAVVNGWIVDHTSFLTRPEWQYLQVQMPNFLVGTFGQVQESTSAWRYTMMSGLIPAIPLIVIRPFLPESPTWRLKKQSGTLKRPSILAIFAPELRKTTIVTTLMVAANYGAAFGAIQQMPDIVPGLKDVQEQVTAAQERARAKVVADANKENKTPEPKAVERAAAAARKPIENLNATEYTKVQEIGGLFGRLAFAMLAASALASALLLRKFQIPGMVLVPLVFFLFLKIPNNHFFDVNLEWAYLGKLPITTMSLGMLLAGFFTVSQFSFWGNYLPRVYPTHLRGTGESFAANVGGRMIGTSFAAVTATLAGMHFFGEDAPTNYALVAAGVALFVYVCGFTLSFALPEPKRDLEV